MEMTCVELVRRKALRIEKNSKREIANDYAKGIGRSYDQHENIESVHLDNTEDQTLANDEYSYQSPSYNNLSKLEDNHNNYASEIERIKSMF